MNEQPPVHHFEYDNYDCYFFTSCRRNVKLRAHDIDIVDDDSMEKCAQCLALEIMWELAK